MQGNGEKICAFAGSSAILEGLLLMELPLSVLEESNDGRHVEAAEDREVELGSSSGSGSGGGVCVGGSAEFGEAGSSSREDSWSSICWTSSSSPQLWSCGETSVLSAMVSTFCSSDCFSSTSSLTPCSSLSSSGSSSVLLTEFSSSSTSRESSNPSWARALAMFLRCMRTWLRQGEWSLARDVWSWLGVEWPWGCIPPL